MGRSFRSQGAWMCAALAVSAAACHRPAADADVGPVMFTRDQGLYVVPAGSPLRRQVSLSPVEGGSAVESLDAPGAVEAEPSATANVLAPLTGRVVSLDVKIGQRVARGQVLASLASGDFDQARADAAKAADALRLADQTLQRARGVQAAGGGTLKDVQADQSAVVQARAELARAQGRLIALNGAGGGSSALLQLRAPVSGVVTQLSLARGQQVGDPTAALMTVTDTARVYVTADIPEDEIGHARVGEPVDIVLASNPGGALHGRVSEVDAIVQPDTRRQRVRIAMDNASGRLMPGMYATVRLQVPARSGVHVPQGALLMNNDVTTVLVETRPWAFQRRTVTLGNQTDADAQVLSGLQPGDRVVTRGGVLFGD